jgi:hypothetical protein
MCDLVRIKMLTSVILFPLLSLVLVIKVSFVVALGAINLTLPRVFAVTGIRK